MSTERVYDKTYPGGLYLVAGRVTDAQGKVLDAPPDAEPIGETGAPEAAVAAAVEAEADRVVLWEAAQEAAEQAAYGELIAQAIDTPVAGLDAFLASVTDPAAVEAMLAADERVTAAAHYAARLSELVPPADDVD